MNIRRMLVVIGINVLIFSVGVTAVELGFGGWFGSSRLNRLNLTKNRKRAYDIKGLYPSTSGVAVCTRDGYGLRGSFGTPDRIDILTVGGSTTDQRFINDGETWQDVLQGDFKSHGLDVRVANAGVDGQSTFGHVKDFDWWFPEIPGLRPRYILFYVGLNDFYRADDYGRDDLLGSEHPSLRRRVQDNSAVYTLYRTLAGMYEAQVVHDIGHESLDFSRLKWTDRALINDHDHEALMRPHLEAYAARLEILCERTKRLGAVPVFVTQPSRMYKEVEGRVLGAAKPFPYGDVKINGVDFHDMLGLLNEKTLEVARSRGAIPIDLARTLALEDADFYDFYHMTPAGAAKVGHALYEAMAAPVRDTKTHPVPAGR